MSNPFALLSDEGFAPVSSAKEVKKTAPAKKAAQQPANDKKKAAAPQLKDRHTKGGRSKGDVQGKGKRPFDRSISRTGRGREERKGVDRSLPGGWGSLDPEADQVPADKQDEPAPVPAPAPTPAEPKNDEPKPFLLTDYLRNRQKVPGDKTKGPVAVVQKKKAPTVNTNKKTLSVDEFKLVSGDAVAVERREQYRRRPNPRSAVDFPSL